MKNDYSMMKLTTFLSFILLLIGSNSAWASKKVSKRVESNCLFVQSASKLKLEMYNKNPNFYKITLKGVNPSVVYFTERPNRDTGILPTKKFIQFWYKDNFNSFRNNPPNASIVATKTHFFSEDGSINLVVELTEPHYDQKSKTLTYKAKRLKGSSKFIVNSETFDHAAVFIDNVCLSCWNH